MLRTLPLASIVLFGSGLTPAAAAQWTADTAANQVISSAPSDQNQVKVAAALDGGFWVSWLDGQASGWDVRIQRLDLEGNAVFPAGGLLVADRSFSSTQDYGLGVADNGDALLAFRDDRGGGVEITAARVSETGAFVWGALGITVTSGAGFVAAPKIVPGNADGAIIAWTENSSVRAQWINFVGNPGWGAGYTAAPAAGSYGLSDMHAVGEGAVLSMVHQTGGFTSPRHLVAQRLDRFGAAEWGGAPVTIFDGGSLQFGAFPTFETDGGEGSVFAWYSSSPALQSFVQRLDGAGNAIWPLGGVPVATSPGSARVNPRAMFDAATGHVVAAWKEQNTAQSQSGISAQRFDAAGSRLWSDSGVSLVPVGASGADFPIVTTGVAGAQTLLTWEEAPSFNADRAFGALIDLAGIVTAPRFDVASTPSGKARYASTKGLTGLTLLAWSDARSDGGDITAQVLSPDGGPGGDDVISTQYCGPNLNSNGLEGLTFLIGSPAVGDHDVTLIATQIPIGTFAFFITSRLPGFNPNPVGSGGNLCLGGQIGRFVGPGQILNSGPDRLISLTLDLAQHPTPNGLVPVLAGERWHYQAWHRDIGGIGNSNFTSGAYVDFQ